MQYSDLNIDYTSILKSRYYTKASTHLIGRVLAFYLVSVLFYTIHSL